MKPKLFWCKIFFKSNSWPKYVYFQMLYCGIWQLYYGLGEFQLSGGYVLWLACGKQTVIAYETGTMTGRKTQFLTVSELHAQQW